MSQLFLHSGVPRVLTGSLALLSGVCAPPFCPQAVRSSQRPTLPGHRLPWEEGSLEAYGILVTFALFTNASNVCVSVLALTACLMLLAPSLLLPLQSVSDQISSSSILEEQLLPLSDS